MAGSPLQSAAAGEEALALLIREVTGEPGAARCSLFGLIDVVHWPKFRAVYRVEAGKATTL